MTRPASTRLARPAWTRLAGSSRSRLLVALEVVAVGLLGALLGLLVAADVRTDVGPFEADMSLRPALSGSTVVELPPLGQLQLDTHDAPVRLDVRVAQLDGDAARAIAADPASLRGLGTQVDSDLRAGLRGLLMRTALVTVIGAAALGTLVFRRWRTTLVAALTGVAALAGVGGVTLLTLDQRALSEPRFTGLLASAPTAVGDVRDIVERFDAYSLQLGRLVTNVSELYSVTSRLPVFTPADGTVRVLHVSDLHLNPASYDLIDSVVEQFGVQLVLDTGDSTDLGSGPESRYVEDIRRLGVPYAWVRGNHDSRLVQTAVDRQPGTTVLDGPEVVEVAGLRLLGRGDPRFTPDKSTRDDDAPPEVLELVGEQLLEAYDAAADKPDVVMVHDPATAGPLLGRVPLVLAGHAHERRSESVDGTQLLVQGSTGGAGLRALEGEEPTPITMTVLYFDPDERRLQAYDEITLGGLGDSDARISRRVVDPEPLEDPLEPEPTPSAASPVPALRGPRPSATPG